MKTEFIPKFVTLLAGAIVCIISIVRDMDTTYSLAVLLAVLIIFYMIGCLARYVIEKVMVSNRFMKAKSSAVPVPDSPQVPVGMDTFNPNQIDEENTSV